MRKPPVGTADRRFSLCTSKLPGDRTAILMWMEGMEQHGVRQGLQRGSQEDRTAGTENPIEKYAQLRYHEDGTIVVTDDWKERETECSANAFSKCCA